MGMPISAETPWTVEALWALPDDSLERRELVDGVLHVTPSPSLLHQRVAFELGVELRAYCQTEGIGVVAMAPLDLVLDWRDSVVQPDLLVLPPDVPVHAPRGLQGVTISLMVEVLSPTSARTDRLRKRPRYLRAGIPVWLVDPDGWVIEQWTPGDDQPVVCGDWLTWTPPGATAPFRLDVAAFFARVIPGGA